MQSFWGQYPGLTGKIAAQIKPPQSILVHELDLNYALTFDNSGETQRVPGADLTNHLLLSLDTRPGSELIICREIAE
ncbi:MAG: hypothetical protein ACLQM8_13455 [Limisphaerales bacterium]